MHYHRTVILPDKSSVLLKASRKQSQLIFYSKSITEITYKHWTYTSDIHPPPPWTRVMFNKLLWNTETGPRILSKQHPTCFQLKHTVGDHLPFKLPKPFTGLRVQSTEVSLSRHLTGWNKLLCILGNWVLHNISANVNTGWVSLSEMPGTRVYQISDIFFKF